jgi:hypothetical protein|nr:MAG TPA_asm: hypothetical protein [Caudoviricetes sp.]
MCTSTDWRGQAISFLQRRTNATPDVIEHFVELGWEPEDTAEENLDRFEVYRSEFDRAFS